MPKVTDEYREQRRQQILSAAWDLFATNGFHATSMAQIISASNLSAGAVYLYFSSKEDLIKATAERALGTARSVTQAILADPEPATPGAAAVRLITRIHNMQEETGRVFFPVAIQAWAEAVRNAEIADIAQSFFGQLQSDVAAIIERWSATGHQLAATPQRLAQLVAGVLQGYIIQQAAFGVAWDPDYVAVLGDRITAMTSTDPVQVGSAHAGSPPADSPHADPDQADTAPGEGATSST